MPKADVMTWRRERFRDLVGTVVAEDGPRDQVNQRLDLYFACWRRTEWQPLLIAADLVGVVDVHAPAIMEEVLRESARLRQLGYATWIAAIAQRYGQSVARIERRFARLIDRWNRTEPTLPDDWAWIERMALVDASADVMADLPPDIRAIIEGSVNP